MINHLGKPTTKYSKKLPQKTDDWNTLHITLEIEQKPYFGVTKNNIDQLQYLCPCQESLVWFFK